jgi:hypothetical protein
MLNSIKQDVFFYPYFKVPSVVWYNLLNLNLCKSFENVGLYNIFIGLLWWLFITWWSLKLIIVSNLVSLKSRGFGMLTHLVGLNGYFLMRSCFAMCSNHFQLMFRKKGFSSPPKPPPPRKPSWGHVFVFGFDMFVRCYECMWVSYYVVDFLRFLSTLGFSFRIQLAGVLIRTRKTWLF